MKISEMVLGIDLGGTIHHKVNDETVPMPDAFRVIADLKRRVKGVYIISRVTDEQSMRAYQWFQKFNFFEETTLTPNKIHFCYEREDKSPIAKRLGVNCFIDDRPEVFFYMDYFIPLKLLMNPRKEDLLKFPQTSNKCHIVKAWMTVENIILNSVD